MRPIRFLTPLLLLLTACAPDAPVDRSERYTLTRSGVGQLPLPLAQRQGCNFTLIGGEAALNRAEGRYTSVLAVRQQCPAAGRDTVLNRGTIGTYEPMGDSVVFLDAAGDTSGVGTLLGDTLTLRGPAQTLVFVRSRGAR